MPSSLEPTYLIIMMSQIQGSESVENYQQLYYWILKKNYG